MRRALPLVLTLVLMSGVAPPGQAAPGRPQMAWVREVGAVMRSVATTADGSIVAVGERATSITRKAILVKMTSAGQVEWRRSWLPNVEASTHGMAVDVMPNGRIVWVGRVQGQCEGAGWFLEILGPGGALLHRYVTPGWQCSIAQSIRDVAVTDGLIVVAGFDHGCCGDTWQDGWIRAFDGKARPMWRAPFEPPAPTPASWFDRATGVAIGRQHTVYAAGWASNRYAPPGDEAATRGTPLLQKMSEHGRVLWSRRANVSVPSLDTNVALAVRGDRVMVAASVRGRGAGWYLGEERGSDGWLGRFTPTGRFIWSRSWDTASPNAAEPGDVAIDASSVTWVVGTRRDEEDHSTNPFLRRVAKDGTLVSDQMLSDATRYMRGTGVAVRSGARGYVTGWFGRNAFESLRGTVYRFDT